MIIMILAKQGDNTFSIIQNATLSEEIAHPTVYYHLSQVSVDNHLSGLDKCRENSGVQMPLSQVVFCSLAWIYLSPLS